LWASLLAHDLYNDLVLISDDAAQFKLLAFLHALCWVHMERHVARLIPLTAAQRDAHDVVRDAIWKYYQRLKAYRESPTPQRRGRLENDFDRLFLKETGWSELNEALQAIHAKKSGLLLVLDHPEGAIPNWGHAAVRLECFFVDGCVDISSPSSIAFNSARHAGGSHRHSVLRSLAIASRV
jgi:hypothetical protein